MIRIWIDLQIEGAIKEMIFPKFELLHLRLFAYILKDFNYISYDPRARRCFAPRSCGNYSSLSLSPWRIVNSYHRPPALALKLAPYYATLSRGQWEAYSRAQVKGRVATRRFISARFQAARTDQRWKIQNNTRLLPFRRTAFFDRWPANLSVAAGQ